MDQDSQSPAIMQRHRSTAQKDKSDRLGEVLAEYITQHITPQQGQLEQLSKVWARLITVQFRRHCAITQLSGGQLKVQVDSPSYLYRLRSLNRELLDELSRCSPRVPVKKIKFSIGPILNAGCRTLDTRYDGNRESRIERNERA